MARIIWATDVRVNADAVVVNEQVVFSGGRVLPRVPALYDNTDTYVIPVNIWFLTIAQSHKDLDSQSRALRHYWSFLERNHLAWDCFKMAEVSKPTYRWRNELKEAADKGMRPQHSTASVYVNCVVHFYQFAMDNKFLIVSDERFAPFKYIKKSPVTGFQPWS